MNKIIFVCTGNTCRSPMAEMIMKNLLNESNINPLEISSRGLSVFGPSTVNPHVVTVLSNEQINLESHCSTLLSEDDFTSDTLIFTMTDAHKQLVDNLFPAYSDQTYTLAKYVTGTHIDIQDPYGWDINVYKECFFQLKGFLTLLVDILIKNQK